MYSTIGYSKLKSINPNKSNTIEFMNKNNSESLSYDTETFSNSENTNLQENLGFIKKLVRRSRRVVRRVRRRGRRYRRRRRRRRRSRRRRSRRRRSRRRRRRSSKGWRRGDGMGTKEVLVTKRARSRGHCVSLVRRKHPRANGVTLQSRGRGKCYAEYNMKRRNNSRAYISMFIKRRRRRRSRRRRSRRRRSRRRRSRSRRSRSRSYRGKKNYSWGRYKKRRYNTRYKTSKYRGARHRKVSVKKNYGKNYRYNSNKLKTNKKSIKIKRKPKQKWKYSKDKRSSQKLSNDTKKLFKKDVDLTKTKIDKDYSMRTSKRKVPKAVYVGAIITFIVLMIIICLKIMLRKKNTSK